MSPLPEYGRLDGLGLAALVRAGAVTPRELVEEAIRRIEARNPRVNALAHPLFERAREEAGPLGPAPRDPGPPTRAAAESEPWRVPFLIKDLLSSMEGAPLTRGSRLYSGHVASTDSGSVRRYRAAGLIVTGTTTCPEFGLLPVTESTAYGATRNPWDRERSSGGSSGGSAAAVAAGMVPWAGAGDGAGSIRIPASCCGLFGLKPGRGTTPVDAPEDQPLRGFAQEHVLTRSVQDSAAVLDRTTGRGGGADGGPGPNPAPGPARGEPGSAARGEPGRFLDEVFRNPGPLRVAYWPRPLLGTELDSECEAAAAETAHLMAELGHHVEETAPPVRRELFARSFLTVLAGEVAADLAEARAEGLRPAPGNLEVETWALALAGGTLPAEAYARALRDLEAETSRVLAFFRTHDVLLTPTLPVLPPANRTLRPTGLERAGLVILGRLRAGRTLLALGVVEKAAESAFGMAANTPIFNVTGQPAMSVPLQRSRAGLPIGMQFVARPGEEGLLFRLAGQLERARPWAHRYPPDFPPDAD